VTDSLTDSGSPCDMLSSCGPAADPRPLPCAGAAAQGPLRSPCSFAAPERPREGSTRASRRRVRASTQVCCRWRVGRLMLSAPRIPRGPRSREVGLFQHHRELMGFQVHARRPGGRLR
jgi:hypothetical protein